MIIINKNLKVIYPFNFDNAIEIITMKLIQKKAYKGYIYYNTIEYKNAEYCSYDEFIKMDEWKIKFSFQIYLERVLKTENLGYNPKDKTLLRCYLKNCLFKPISNNFC
jgi:hypothetical protein